MSGTGRLLGVPFLLLVAATAHADVVCVKTVGNERPVTVRAASACKMNERLLGSFAAFRMLLAASSIADDGATLQLTGNVRIASPVAGDPGFGQARAEASASPAAPPLGETVRYCQGGGFPGEVGGQFACATNADCTGICVAGEDSVLGGQGGHTCTANFQCNTRLQNDGVCSTGAGCQEFALLSVVGPDVFFTGFNVHVAIGTRARLDPPINGRGNLLLGYNAGSQDRGGSHNLIVGDQHSYISFNGLAGGRGGTLSGPDATISAGASNTASATAASVSGGQSNRVTHDFASVSAGHRNLASNVYASVSGGEDNIAQGAAASVSGGNHNHATGPGAAICGGQFNTASGFRASVSGGEANLASGTFASVSGGVGNVAGPGFLPLPVVSSDFAPSISGGQHNQANGTTASVSGGASNIAGPGRAPSVSGGFANIASGRSASVSAGVGNMASGSGTSTTGGSFNQATGESASVSGGSRVLSTGAFDWRAGRLFEED